MADYSTLPSGATLKPKPYKAHVPEEKLQLLKDLAVALHGCGGDV